jgi:SAM-dependent methyltransferase
MQKKVLNVGGNSKAIAIPEYYNGWIHHLLDIDPKGNPDIVCDARNLEQIMGNEYDSIYCSHNLEHYYSHDVLKVLRGFHHVLKSDGFIHITVPDIQAVMLHVIENNMDINDILYQSPMGPIAVKDVIYGHAKQIEQSSCDFYAHKTGFSVKSLLAVISECEFPETFIVLETLKLLFLLLSSLPVKIYATY